MAGYESFSTWTDPGDQSQAPTPPPAQGEAPATPAPAPAAAPAAPAQRDPALGDFKDTTAMAAALREAQALVTRQGQENALLRQGQPTPAGDPPADPAPGTPPAPGQQEPQPGQFQPITAAALEPYYEEYERLGGRISEESYLEIQQKFGADRASTDTFIAGRVAGVSALVTQAYDAAGGEDRLTAMLDWAEANMPQADLRQYNDALASQDGERIRFTVAGMRAQYEAVKGFAPAVPPLEGGRPDTTGVEPFTGTAEVVEIMKTKAYKDGDAATHKMVADRMRQSETFNRSFHKE